MDDNTAGRVYFNIGALAERDRLGALYEIYGRTIIKHDIEPIGESPFEFESTLYRLPGLGLASSIIAPCRAPRGRRHIDGDDLVLNISRSGGRLVEQRGREAVVRAGEAVLTTSADPGIVSIASKSQIISLRIPTDVLKSRVGNLDDCLVRAIPRDTPALVLLTGYIDALLNADGPARSDLRDLAVAHIHDLVSLIITNLRDAVTVACSPGLRAARLAAILHAIESRSSDADLSAAAVAARLGVTTRYVHLLLEPTGRNFTHHVLDKRLERAAALLRDPLWRDRRIADIAGEAGFTDLSYFNRAFRRHHAMTPTDMRNGLARSRSPRIAHPQQESAFRRALAGFGVALRPLRGV